MSRSRLAIWVLTTTGLSVLYVQSIAAQVVPDKTLPVGERSQVTGNPNAQIDGGARRGGNLFHSFSQFSVPIGGSAFFNNAADVQNIFSRVTGGSISNIDGFIRANGTASLFLLNPNGILFGPNASLNIGGSFVGTTANAIGFPNGEVFSSDATQPLPSQLLTINPNTLFFNQLVPQPIINRSTSNGTGLQVPSRQNLMLVGGSVQLKNGRLTSPGSYVELGGVGGVGIVGLATMGEDWQLTMPEGVTRVDVSLSNRSVVDVTGDSGSIRMLAQNIDISESELQMGIPKDSRLPNTQTGDLDLKATGSIALSMSSLENDLVGQGTLGDINLTAREQILLDGGSINGAVRLTGVGNVGSINITTGSLALTNFSIQSYTEGQGSAGNVNISARDTVSFDNGYVYTISRPSGGNAGDINIATGSLALKHGALVSLQNGSSNAGGININARDTVSLSDSSGLASYAIASGNAGGININAHNAVSLDKSSIFNLIIPDTGNVGGVNITTGSLSLTNGADLLSTTVGQGNGGSVNINARDRVSVDGASTFGADTRYYRTSSIRTLTVTGSEGQGGDVTIATGSLFLTNGGGVDTSTLGRGNAGRVFINARDVQIRGTSPPLSAGLLRLATRTDYRSGVYTSATPGSVGNAGNVSINTGTLSVADQGRINTNAQGHGRAGNIQIQASDAVSFDRGDAISTLGSGALGNGGNIDITARSLSVLNGAQLSASTAGEGNAGNITVSAQTFNLQNQAEVTVSSSKTGSAGSLFVAADRIALNNQGSIRADTSGGGGNINVRSPLILLRNGSNITTNATGANIPGGNIAIDTRFLIAVLNEDSNISANSEDFRGGNIRINTFSIFGIQPSLVSTPLSDITATGATSALSGTIDVITSGLDPISGLGALPTDLADPSRLIAQGCPANQGNSFVITGRGGLPPTPEQQLDDDAAWSDRRRLVVAREGREQEADFGVSAQSNEGRRGSKGGRGDTETRRRGDEDPTPYAPHPTPHTPILEATGWQITSTGEVYLVASTPDPTVQNRLHQAVTCQGR